MERRHRRTSRSNSTGRGLCRETPANHRHRRYRPHPRVRPRGRCSPARCRWPHEPVGHPRRPACRPKETGAILGDVEANGVVGSGDLRQHRFGPHRGRHRASASFSRGGDSAVTWTRVAAAVPWLRRKRKLGDRGAMTVSFLRRYCPMAIPYDALMQRPHVRAPSRGILAALGSPEKKCPSRWARLLPRRCSFAHRRTTYVEAYVVLVNWLQGKRCRGVSDESVPCGDGGGLAPAAHSEFAEDVADMLLRSARAEKSWPGHRGRSALAEQGPLPARAA